MLARAAARQKEIAVRKALALHAAAHSPVADGMCLLFGWCGAGNLVCRVGKCTVGAISSTARNKCSRSISRLADFELHRDSCYFHWFLFGIVPPFALRVSLTSAMKAAKQRKENAARNPPGKWTWSQVALSLVLVAAGLFLRSCETSDAGHWLRPEQRLIVRAD